MRVGVWPWELMEAVSGGCKDGGTPNRAGFPSWEAWGMAEICHCPGRAPVNCSSSKCCLAWVGLSPVSAVWLFFKHCRMSVKCLDVLMAFLCLDKVVFG